MHDAVLLLNQINLVAGELAAERCCCTHISTGRRHAVGRTSGHAGRSIRQGHAAADGQGARLWLWLWLRLLQHLLLQLLQLLLMLLMLPPTWRQCCWVEGCSSCLSAANSRSPPLPAVPCCRSWHMHRLPTPQTLLASRCGAGTHAQGKQCHARLRGCWWPGPCC